MLSPEPKLDVYTLLLITGVMQGALIAFLLITNRKNDRSNLFLGLLVLVLTLSALEIFLNYTGLILNVLFLYNFSESLQYLIGPFLYFYFRELKGSGTAKFKFLHILPFILFTSYLLIEFTAPLSQKYNNYVAGYFPGTPFIKVPYLVDPDPLGIRKPLTSYVIYTHLGMYLLLSLRVVRNLFVGDRRRTDGLVWVRNFAVISIVGIVLFPISKSIGIIDGENVVGLYLTFLVYVIGYFVVKGSTFFKALTGKYQSSNMPKEFIDLKLEKLREVMSSEQPFLKSDFSVKDLSERLKISEHQLSQLINENLKTNFFGLANSYRIEEACRLLKDDRFDHLKIEQIGYEVGYNSKSAFFKAFKKEVNTTPQLFRGKN